MFDQRADPVGVWGMWLGVEGSDGNVVDGFGWSLLAEEGSDAGHITAPRLRG